jgi:hypothetical protein
MNNDEAFPLSRLAPKSLIKFLCSADGVAHNRQSLLDAVHPWIPTKSMLTLVQSIVVTGEDDSQQCCIDGTRLLLQEEAVDTISIWVNDMDPSIRGMKNKVTQILRRASVRTMFDVPEDAYVLLQSMGYRIAHKGNTCIFGITARLVKAVITAQCQRNTTWIDSAIQSFPDAKFEVEKKLLCRLKTRHSQQGSNRKDGEISLFKVSVVLSNYERSG